MRAHLLVLYIMLMGSGAFAQDQLFIQGPMVVQQGADLYVQGGVNGQELAALSLDGEIVLSNNTDTRTDDWTNGVDSLWLTGKGLVRFNSPHGHVLKGRTQVFHQAVLDSDAEFALTLETDFNIDDSLHLEHGVIHTLNFTTRVHNTAVDAISGYDLVASTSNYVNGQLERAIDFNTETYDFPVGNDQRYLPMSLTNERMSGPQYVAVRFNSVVPELDNEVEESGLSYTSLCETGVWELIPDIPVVGGSYSVNLYHGQMDCGLKDNQFAPLLFNDGWDCGNCGVGTGINDINQTGRLMSDEAAIRNGLRDMGLLGIGRICRIPQLVADTTFCVGELLALDVGDGYEKVRWFELDDDQLVGSDQLFMVNTPGSYYVKTIDITGCEQSDTASVEGFESPVIDLGPDTVTCPADHVLLAVAGNFDQFLWSNGAQQRSIQVNSEQKYAVTVTDFNGCTGQDEISVNHYAAPLAEIDYPELEENTTINIDVLANDPIVVDMEVTIVTHPVNGLAEVDGHLIHYEPDPNYWGLDSITYNSCEVRCPNNCVTETVVIEVQDDQILEIPQGFSPDGDGFNDVFLIEGLDSYPDNEFIVHDRWGDVVFQAAPYQNDWAGETNRGPRPVAGELVPEGSYFYVLHLADGQPDQKGYIVIEY